MSRSARERLSEAAIQLFDERGYEATTVDEIAERAGVGRTTFFRTFGSKEEVIFPHHEPLLDAVAARLDAASPGAEPIALVEAARLVLRHYLDEGDLARTRYALTRTVPALRQREIAGMLAYQRVFRDHVAPWLTGHPEGALRAELIAAAVVTAHNHALRHWLRGEAADPDARFDAAMQEVLALLHRALGTETDAPAALLVVRTAADLDRVLPQVRALLG